jgi:hypothetical protein
VSFLHPWALAGLAAAAVPVILHLIARRQPPTVIFPAVRYLLDTTREHQHRLRLRNLLLLLVRTALIVVIVLAAAGPSVPVSGVPGHLPSALVLIADNSVSSGAMAGGTSRLDEIKQAADDILARATPEDDLWLITADGIAVSGDRAGLGLRIDSLLPTDFRLDLGEAIAEADAILSGEDRPGEIFLITDLQLTAVTPADPQAPLVVVRPSGSPIQNLGLGDLATGTQPWQIDGGALMVTVVGDSGRSAALTVTAGNRPDRQTLAPAGTPVAVRIGGLSPGWWPVDAALDPDEFRADDRRVTALRIAPVAAVSWDEADRYLATAVRVLESNGRLNRGAEVRVGGLGGRYSVVFPPADQAELGALNRALERRGIEWRYGGQVFATESSDSSVLLGSVDVHRRYRLESMGSGLTGVLVTVGDEPWIVRHADVILMGSRIDPDWTSLPISVEFVPFMDALLNRVARGEVSLLEVAPGDVVLLPDLAGGVVREDNRWDVEGGAPFRPPATGVYYLTAGSDTIGALAANIDRRESFLDPADDRTIRQLWHPARIVEPRQAGDVVFAAAARGDLRGALIWLALLLGVWEVGLASLRTRET